ncbi:MAG: ATP-binding protein [Oscillospiraceae bacterium]|nr:ATP-binding protein [Oscillospiraceae bacterium]
MNKNLFDNIPVACSLWNEACTNIGCNKEELKLFCLQSREEYQKRYLELFPKYQPNGKLSNEFVREKIGAAFKSGYECFEFVHVAIDGDPLPCEIKLILVDYEGDAVVAAYKRDLREYNATMINFKQTQEKLEYNQKMTESMNKAAILFLSQHEKSFTDTMADSVKLIVEAANVDRFSIWRNSNKEDGLHSSMIYRWDSEFGGISSPKTPFSDISYAKYVPGWAELFKKSKTLNGPARLIPELNADLFKNANLMSIFVAPVVINDTLWGFTLFEDLYAERYFNEIEAQSLHSAAFLFVNTIIRAERENEITEANNRSRLLLDATPICCQLWDENLNIVDCNEAGVKLYSLKDKQEYKDKFFEFSPEFQPSGERSGVLAHNYISEAFEKGRCIFEWVHKHPNGDLIPAEITLVRIDYKGHDVVAGYTRDLREHKKMMNKIQETNHNLEEEQKKLKKALLEAKAASDAKSKFLSNMSHEIRTPLNAIIGMTSIGKKADDITNKNYALEKIGNASTHLLNIVNDVLDMAKIEADKLELSPVEFNFVKMLDKVIAIINFKIDEKQQRLLLNIDKNIPRFLIADDNRLTQVITNLLSNAAKFTPENGEIHLDVFESFNNGEKCELRVEISDNGIGITPEQQKKLFSAFEQAESDINRKYGGTGLGLVISKSIVELMGGRIWVESEIGKGSKFIFTVMTKCGTQVDNEDEISDASEMSAANTISGEFKGKGVLIVEDIAVNREVLISILEDSEITVYCAENGQEALTLFETEPEKYDIVLMDVQMPVMDGLEATRRIRAHPNKKGEKLPIVAMTSNVFKTDIDDCINAGMNNHLGKPLDDEKVIETLRLYIGNKKRSKL